MREIIIIGNGFDLAHTLETKYSDFILWYLNKAIKSLTQDGIYDDDLINFSTKIRYNFPPLEEIIDFKNILYKDIVRSYKKGDFLKKIIEQGINKRWVDIESFYYKELVSIYRTIEETNFRSDYFTKAIAKTRDLNSTLDIMKLKLIDYLDAINQNLDSFYNKDMHDLIRTFLLDGNSEQNECLFLNFNYTKTLELYVQRTDKILINYIHGDLRDNLSDNIIFGYGDEQDLFYPKLERLNENEFLKNFKSFRYFKNEKYQNFMSFINDEPFNVRIFGHSCGLSDKILFSTIFEHSNCVKIYPYYYEKEDNTNDFFEKTVELSRHFKDKVHMRGKIAHFYESGPLPNNI